MVPDTLTVGLVGTGSVAQSAHIPAWSAIPNVDIAAIADPDTEARRAATASLEDHGSPTVSAHETVDDLLVDEQVDIIDVTVPPGKAKAQAIRSALTAGCHVTSQKPFVEDIDIGRELVDLAMTEDRILSVNQQARFAGAFAAAKKYLDNSQVGTPRTMTIRSDFPFQGNRRWYSFSSHTVDLVRFWAGREPDRVMAWHKRQTDDNRYLLGIWLDYEDELAAEIWDEFSSSSTQRWSFRIMGSDGIIAGHEAYTNEMFSPELRYTPAGDIAETIEPVATSYVPDAFRAYFEAFVESVTGDGPVPTPAHENIHTVELLTAAEKSFDRGTWIDIDGR